MISSLLPPEALNSQAQRQTASENGSCCPFRLRHKTDFNDFCFLERGFPVFFVRNIIVDKNGIFDKLNFWGPFLFFFYLSLPFIVLVYLLEIFSSFYSYSNLLNISNRCLSKSNNSKRLTQNKTPFFPTFGIFSSQRFLKNPLLFRSRLVKIEWEYKSVKNQTSCLGSLEK